MTQRLPREIQGLPGPEGFSSLRTPCRSAGHGLLGLGRKGASPPTPGQPSSLSREVEPGPGDWPVPAGPLTLGRDMGTQAAARAACVWRQGSWSRREERKDAGAQREPGCGPNSRDSVSLPETLRGTLAVNTSTLGVVLPFVPPKRSLWPYFMDEGTHWAWERSRRRSKCRS